MGEVANRVKTLMERSATPEAVTPTTLVTLGTRVKHPLGMKIEIEPYPLSREKRTQHQVDEVVISCPCKLHDETSSSMNS